ncbi:hypothetical protein THSYN_16315 [Candidatus Thiodictyon syntrophicum]|uniref:HigA2-like helix-turn-helix domain-containing protein n=1 Tax=Candidatus Thiodictyon syntrophicum TaxID=1166950 RepID=A0A2K8U9U6_9GAMM|nr:XRE family transcriptional regulator [Candidatus Thiodictyon syntrophicum]AUB82356.1 hypothetical protein THSYN_16315 [Candidatus Thiodictyon syntrophicum]
MLRSGFSCTQRASLFRLRQRQRQRQCSRLSLAAGSRYTHSPATPPVARDPAPGRSQSRAAKLLGVTQPRVCDLMRGKINLFGLDCLVNIASAAG